MSGGSGRVIVTPAAEVFHGCSINSVINQVHSSTDWHAIDLNSIADFGYDTDGFWDSDNGQFALPAGFAGLYEVFGFVTWPGNAVTAAAAFVIAIDLYHGTSGELALQEDYLPAGNYNMEGSQLVRWSGHLDEGDTFNLRVRQTSGNNFAFDPDEWLIGLSAKLLSKD